MLPEEQELSRLESEQSQLEEQVATAELERETAKIDIARFERRYYEKVGRLYAQLDDLDAQMPTRRRGASPTMPPRKPMRRPRRSTPESQPRKRA